MSRKIFVNFLKKNTNLTRVDNRNVCEDVFGNRYAFCITTKKNIECRQFYEDCSDVISFNLLTNIIKQIPRQRMRIDAAANRITTKGIRAYTAKADIDNAFTSNFVM